MQLDLWAAQVWPTLNVTRKTLTNYEGAYRRNLSTSLGLKDLKEISRSDLLQVLDRLTPHSRYQALMVAKVLFREALQHQQVKDTPTAGIPSRQPISRPLPFLRWEDLKTLDFGSQTARIHFLALHGLRYGEAAALQESDIRGGRIHVERSIHGATKSPSGVRTVPQVSPFEPFPRYQNSIAKQLKTYGVNVHSLRRTYAYILKCSGVHVTTASKLMGHSNPNITMKIYTAVLDDEIDQTKERLTRYI